METIHRPLPPIPIGDLDDDDERPCGEVPIQHIRAATTASGRVWVLDSESHLVSFDAALEHRKAHLTKKVVDLVRRADDGSLWAVVNEENRWRVLRYDAKGWQHLADFPERFWTQDSIGEREGRPVLATRDGETYWFDAAGLVHFWKYPLEGHYRWVREAGGKTHLASTNDGSMYIARDAGEFGGRLEWIRVGTAGRPTFQKQVFDGSMTDVIVDPLDRSCVIASNGLLHANSGDGFIARVCPNNSAVVLEEKGMADLNDRRSHVKIDTLPFSKLVTSGNTVYAFGLDQIYAITGHAKRRIPPPVFTEHCGQSVARVEGLMLLRLPRLLKEYPYDAIGHAIFAMPAP
ncbi:hypothetical protein AKJ09_04973 [Labilithrix luteola]|uniref:Uncharacterized protein n=1 Tax=Labilithrix luteola TaxID=1391654 RepID=A0A0K1PYU1_9BACT|nr:hypothetical protein AKJ09_04973 [Labilithrix luteola]